MTMISLIATPLNQDGNWEPCISIPVLGGWRYDRKIEFGRALTIVEKNPGCGDGQVKIDSNK